VGKQCTVPLKGQKREKGEINTAYENPKETK